MKIAEIGFGALQIMKIPEDKAIKLVKESYELGINYFDTAHSYRNSEDVLGRSLKNVREKVIISTKSCSTKKKDFLDDLEASLKRLRTDYIDIFLFHDISRVEKFEEIISNGVAEALIKEKRKGKVNHIGFSCHSPDLIERYYEIDDFSVLMIPISFVSPEFTLKKIMSKVKRKKIGLLGMKPLGGGRLKDIELCFKYLKGFPNIIPVVGISSIDELKQDISFFKTNTTA